ncbi:MAG: YlxM family DNA-binding protein [Butyrivibrio sp.]|nr:YlxM family DNA-binding protein [Butyrivibrio sp.]
MEKIVEQAMLYDFYGELLGEHQKSVFEEYVLDNLSLGEIAEERGISRQGVHDLIKRADRTLAGYEAKLHLVSKFMAVKDRVNRIYDISGELAKEGNPELAQKIRGIADEIMDEF